MPADGSEEIRVTLEGLEPALPWRYGSTGTVPLEEPTAWDRALDSLEHGVEEGRGLVVLDGPEGTGKSSGLRELARRLRGLFHVVLVAGAPLSPEALGLRVLAALGNRESGDPQRDLALRAEGLRAQGRPLALLVDDGEALPDETVRWLTLLAEPPSALARVVLAVPDYAVLLGALTGLGTCVDLVRLDPLAAPPAARAGGGVEPAGEPAPPLRIAPERAAPAPVAGVASEPVAEPPPPLAVPQESRQPVEPGSCEPAPAPEQPALPEATEPAPALRPEPPPPLEPSGIAELAFEPVDHPAVAAPPGEAPTSEPPYHGLLTVEELLGDAEYPVFDGPAPEPVPSVGDVGDRLPPGEPRPAVPDPAAESALHAAVESPPPRPAPAPAARLPRRTTPQPALVSEGTTTRVRRGPKSHRAPWLLAGLGAAVAFAWLAVPLLRGTPAPSVSAPGVRPAPSREVHLSGTTARATPSEPGPGPAAARPAGGVVVSELRQAFDLLIEGADGDSHAAALRFLREHGPDSEGYELLDELDRRRPRDPQDAAKILAARSRVRAALCASWADDSRGEAAGRLGCPGAESAPR
jgi:hypothetical protein